MKILTQLKQEMPEEEMAPRAGGAAPPQPPPAIVVTPPCEDLQAAERRLQPEEREEVAKVQEQLCKALDGQDEQAKKAEADKKAIADKDKIAASSTPAPTPTAPKPEPKKRSAKEIEKEIKGLKQELESAKNKLEALRSDSPYVQFFINACVAAINGGSIELGKWNGQNLGSFDMGMTRRFSNRIKELQQEKEDVLKEEADTKKASPDAAPDAAAAKPKEPEPAALAAAGVAVDGVHDVPPLPVPPPPPVLGEGRGAAEALADGAAAAKHAERPLDAPAADPAAPGIR